MAQMVKNLLAIWEIWVRSLGWEDPLEQEMTPTPVFLPGEFHGQRNLVGCSPWGCKEWDTTEQQSTAHTRAHTHACTRTHCCQAPAESKARTLFLSNWLHCSVLPPDRKRWQEVAHLQAQRNQMEHMTSSRLSTQNWTRAPEAEM